MVDLFSPAIEYVEKHRFSVIPIPVGNAKVPEIKWARYQSERADLAQLEKWFAHGKNNIGIVTGAFSGIVVVDVDGPTGEESIRGLKLPRTVRVKTPKGHHLYFKHPGVAVKTGTKILPGVDIRADGGYVVAPPSAIGDKPYAWEPSASLDDLSLSPLPELFWKERPSRDRQGSGSGGVTQMIPTGMRNDVLTRLAGSMRRWGAPEESIENALLENNRLRCEPPLEDDEVRKIAASIARYAPEEMLPGVPGWEIRTDSLWKYKKLGDDEPAPALPFAPIPEAVYRDKEHEVRGLKIRFSFPDRQHTMTVPASVIHAPAPAGSIADAGGPHISTEHVRVLVRFLAEIVSGRGENINEETVVTKARWDGYKLDAPGSGQVASWNGELAAYGNVTDLDEDAARNLWRLVLEQALGSPKSIIVMGMPIGSVFVRPLKLDNFALHLQSESSQGKTESAEIAMSVFGDAQKPHGRLYRTWDVSEQAPIALFRQVGCMPVWFDETAVLGDPARFTTIIFRLAQGTNRMRADAYGGLTEGSADRWDTCLLSTGEARITITSALTGMQRRVIEISAPITDRETHEYILENVRIAHGWPLRWLSQDPDPMWAQGIHETVLRGLSTFARSQQVEVSQAANIATCAMGFAVMCRLAGMKEKEIPTATIAEAAQKVFGSTLERAAERGSDIGERALLAIRSAMNQFPDRFSAPEDSLVRERWGVVFGDGVVGITNETVLGEILDRFGAASDPLPALEKLRDQGKLTHEKDRLTGTRKIYQPSQGMVRTRMNLIKIGDTG